MKKILMLMTLMAFVVSAPMAIAQSKPKKEAPKINCCIKGACNKMTKAECKKAKGKVVKDCAKCK